MGDFEVVNQNGKLKKRGGDVVSAFCTADGRVIHAVGKAVDANRLLDGARWAVATYRKATRATDDRAEQSRVVAEAHLQTLNTDAVWFTSLVKAELPKAEDDYRIATRLVRTNQWRQPRGPDVLRVPPATAARIRAANRLSGDVAHKILAARPLAQLDDVSWQLFERLTGERANERRGLVYKAAEGLKQAREKGTPLLFVLYDGHGENREQFDTAMQQFVTHVLKYGPVTKPLESYTVVAVPIRQLPALSNLADVPLFEVPSGQRPAVVVATPNADPVATVSASIAPSDLATLLWPQVHLTWLTRAKELADDGELSRALKLLRRVRLSDSQEVRSQATRQINDIQLELAEQWASRGNRAGALRLLRKVRQDAHSDEVASLVDERIAALDR